MKSVFLFAMPGPIFGAAMLLTLIVVIYSVTKMVMRYLDNKKK